MRATYLQQNSVGGILQDKKQYVFRRERKDETGNGNMFGLKLKIG